VTDVETPLLTFEVKQLQIWKFWYW